MTMDHQYVELSALEAAIEERNKISGQLHAALLVLNRLQSEGATLTRLERNRVCGLPDDWKLLSERYPEYFGGTDA